MLPKNAGADLDLYLRNINKQAPILAQLAQFSRVIWLNQYAVLERYAGSTQYASFIHLEKIKKYNEGVRSLLK